MKAFAAVQTADRTIELQEFDVPDEIGPREALLKVEGSGMCGTDYEQYVGEPVSGSGKIGYPIIPGHEPVGRIAKIGKEAGRLWRVREGDRVAVEPMSPCGICARCIEGNYRLCPNKASSYGYTSTSLGLYGGYAQYMMLRPNTILHRLPDQLTVQDAVLFNPLGAGFEWAHLAAGTRIGDSLLILGPGQRGLACLVAGLESGASTIIVTGLAKDLPKLALAREFGATHTVNVEEEDVVERVRDITGGLGVDRVIDVSAFATRPVVDAIDAVRPGGTVVLAGIKGRKEIPGFVSDKLIFKDLRVRGVLAAGYTAFELAIPTIASHKYPLEKMHSHTLGLREVDRAMRLLGGEVAGEQALHITIVPEV